MKIELDFRDDVANAPLHKVLIGWGNGGWRFMRRDEMGNWRSMIGQVRPAPKMWALPPGAAEMDAK